MFELTEIPKIKVKIYGKEYDLKKPSVRQIQQVTSRLELIKGDGAKTTDEMISFVSGLGIGADILEEMPAEHFNLLVEHVCGVKKN